MSRTLEQSHIEAGIIWIEALLGSIFVLVQTVSDHHHTWSRYGVTFGLFDSANRRRVELSLEFFRLMSHIA